MFTVLPHRLQAIPFGRLIALTLLPFCIANATASPLNIAFVAIEDSPEALGPHDRGAWDTARELGSVTFLSLDKTGAFVDQDEKPRALDDFDVVWHHQGDAIARTALYGGAGLAAIRRFIESGGGVLFSGGALSLIDYFGLEPHVRAQRREIENYHDPAAMVVVERAHPVFHGLHEEDGLIWLSGGGCRALADFYWGGPAEGMLLGNTPAGVERPLVEYALGSGRMILFGWRWPDYADSGNPHRSNLLRLTANLLEYLARPTAWRPVVIRTNYPPLAHPEEPGIVPTRWRALRMAIEDLSQTYPDRYPDGKMYLERLEALRTEHNHIPRDAGAEAFAPINTRFEELQREALLANPLLDFDRLLMIRRRADRLGLPMNYHGNDDLEATGYSNTLVALSPPRPGGHIATVFQPEGDRFIGDLDLHYDAEKALISIPDETGRWCVAELDLDSGNLTYLPLVDEPDVNNYDACYLPDERIVFTSTAPFIGVPCVGGTSKVANLYLLDHGNRIRRLTNDQDHNWCPAVLNNGRILYQRWEYADIAHAFTRLLFHANPDGSRQMEYYGSNSFWPTALFYARPVPDHPTKVVAIAGGHHDAPRQGELVILDPALGRHETSGVVQRIPGHGETVEPVILDGLISASWPRFLHPYPLSENYYLVSCKPSNTALWGIYLVDVFDNFVLLHEEPGWAIFEPIPWRKTERQPIVPDVADYSRTDATVLLVDVYRGPGLEGVPRGSVKSLRLAGYNFTFHGLGAEPDRVGLDGPWDVKRILGTVPVEPDGSAYFEVPACTPISIQPLDAEGKALALMRSWLTAVPGEAISCTGCHEPQNESGPFDSTPLAFRRAPSPIDEWYGPARGFSFDREVQPVLDAYCIECHHGGENGEAPAPFDLTARPAERIPSAFQMHFSPSYMELRRWVHTPTLESDAHLLPPRDFHADNSRLVQMLRDNHHEVRLNAEAWDRLITWIDLNAPYHGSWQEVVASNPTKLAAARHGAERRRELHRRYTGIDEDPDAIYPAAMLERVDTSEGDTLPHPTPLPGGEGTCTQSSALPIPPACGGGGEGKETPHPGSPPEKEGTEARNDEKHADGSLSPRERGGVREGSTNNVITRSQSPAWERTCTQSSALPIPPACGGAGGEEENPSTNHSNDLPLLHIEIAPGISLDLVQITPGEFIMGSNDGYPNERPAHPQTIEKPFYIGAFEITNQQYRCFDPTHNSGLVTGEGYQFGDDERGFTLNRPEQPVVRISWDQAMAFCTWLSGQTGRRFSLPTEAQWEYACRAGASTPLWYGTLDDDFSPFANLSDATHYSVYYHHVPTIHPPWRPADTRFDDGWRVAAPPGNFTPNPWGLHDMHGNIAEWTQSEYRPYPVVPGASPPRSGAGRRMVVRGGSWVDLPNRARAAFRVHYEGSQAMFDVGFRVVLEE